MNSNPWLIGLVVLLVPRSSQIWGELLAEVEADHWAQVGWSSHFDAAALYGELLQELGSCNLAADRLLAAGRRS